MQINYIMSETEQKQDKVWGAEQLLNLDTNDMIVRKLIGSR
jgi:hypothetical protein